MGNIIFIRIYRWDRVLLWWKLFKKPKTPLYGNIFCATLTFFQAAYSYKIIAFDHEIFPYFTVRYMFLGIYPYGAIAEIKIYIQISCDSSVHHLIPTGIMTQNVLSCVHVMGISVYREFCPSLGIQDLFASKPNYDMYSTETVLFNCQGTHTNDFCTNPDMIDVSVIFFCPCCTNAYKWHCFVFSVCLLSFPLLCLYYTWNTTITQNSDFSVL